ncbi:hypothetical protein [Desulfospira joergensenii]|uniref:hypothetical protein n=1 Tax=Desulfospira joergensenii TaxID=53329 RepID=UPI0003B76B0C|nr:hypothetical protein [Desulfospira joergensenii]
MPLHFNDLDIISETAGIRSALIVPCNMCPAITVAVREKKPFMQMFKNPFKSAPFENYLGKLQTRLKKNGVKTKVFKSRLYHQWFMCMWTAGRQKELKRQAEPYEAVIVLGCDSATETVHGAVNPNGCKVIEGMEFTGIMNAKLKFKLPGNISFADCRVIPSPQKEKRKLRLVDRAVA